MSSYRFNASALQRGRARCAMTREDLAEKVGISTQELARYERGRANPLDLGFRLADALSMDIGDLIGGMRTDVPAEPFIRLTGSTSTALYEAMRDNPDELRTVNQWYDWFGHNIKKDTIRSALRRMADCGEVRREGSAFGWLTA